jgi:hypothetical protein
MSSKNRAQALLPPLFLEVPSPILLQTSLPPLKQAPDILQDIHHIYSPDIPSLPCTRNEPTTPVNPRRQSKLPPSIHAEPRQKYLAACHVLQLPDQPLMMIVKHIDIRRRPEHAHNMEAKKRLPGAECKERRPVALVRRHQTNVLG